MPSNGELISTVACVEEHRAFRSFALCTTTADRMVDTHDVSSSICSLEVLQAEVNVAVVEVLTT